MTCVTPQPTQERERGSERKRERERKRDVERGGGGEKASPGISAGRLWSILEQLGGGGGGGDCGGGGGGGGGVFERVLGAARAARGLADPSFGCP